MHSFQPETGRESSEILHRFFAFSCRVIMKKKRMAKKADVAIKIASALIDLFQLEPAGCKYGEFLLSHFGFGQVAWYARVVFLTSHRRSGTVYSCSSQYRCGAERTEGIVWSAVAFGTERRAPAPNTQSSHKTEDSEIFGKQNLSLRSDLGRSNWKWNVVVACLNEQSRSIYADNIICTCDGDAGDLGLGESGLYSCCNRCLLAFASRWTKVWYGLYGMER